MTKSEGMVRISIAYVTALFAGGASLYLLDYGPLLDALVADLIATGVIFGFSRLYGNSSCYDVYWSVVPPLLALYWLAVGGSEVSSLRELLLLGLILYWATRLTLNWAYYWEGMQHEDWRYLMLRQRAPRWAALTDLFGIHLFPTLQMIADFQLHRFIARRAPGEQLESGLWAWSRHPNYFGELGFWCGLFLFGLAAYPQGWYWFGAGAVLMTLMFLRASIPMMEQRSLERRPEYQRVIDTVSMLIPWPRKQLPDPVE